MTHSEQGIGRFSGSSRLKGLQGPRGRHGRRGEGPRDPHTAGNCLQAIEKPLHLHGRAVGASISGSVREPRAARPGQARPPRQRGQGRAAEARLPSERISICVRKDRPHHRWWLRGDTSYSHPAPCDVALEVNRGQTGSPGWYPVLSARLGAKRRHTKMQGVVPAPRNPRAGGREHAALPFCPYQSLSTSPPWSARPPAPLGFSSPLSLLTPGPQPLGRT